MELQIKAAEEEAQREGQSTAKRHHSESRGRDPTYEEQGEKEGAAHKGQKAAQNESVVHCRGTGRPAQCDAPEAPRSAGTAQDEQTQCPEGEKTFEAATGPRLGLRRRGKQSG